MKKFVTFMENYGNRISTILLILVSVCLMIQNLRVFKYQNYVEKTESLLDYIYTQDDDFSDTIVETDWYSEYSEAYIKLW